MLVDKCHTKRDDNQHLYDQGTCLHTVTVVKTGLDELFFLLIALTEKVAYFARRKYGNNTHWKINSTLILLLVLFMQALAVVCRNEKILLIWMTFHVKSLLIVIW